MVKLSSLTSGDKISECLLKFGITSPGNKNYPYVSDLHNLLVTECTLGMGVIFVPKGIPRWLI